jgi:hypothetical protein
MDRLLLAQGVLVVYTIIIIFYLVVCPALVALGKEEHKSWYVDNASWFKITGYGLGGLSFITTIVIFSRSKMD